MVQVIALVGQKGGVGKTTMAMSLAGILSESQQVLVVDTDPQQTAKWWSGLTEDGGDPEAGLPFSVVSERDPALLSRVRSASVDVVIVDTPGSLEDERVLSAVLDHVDLAVLPVQPAPVAVRPVVTTVERLIRPRGLRYRVLLNKVKPSVSRLDVDDVRSMLSEKGMPFFESVVRDYVAYDRSPMYGTVLDMGRDASAAQEDMRRVAVEVLGDLMRGSGNGAGGVR